MLEGRVQPKMPFGGELPPHNIAVIKAWIDAGAIGEEVSRRRYDSASRH